MNIKKNKDIIFNLLTKYKSYRDNDNKLIAHIWANEMNWNPNDEKSAMEFLHEFSRGEYSNPESIRRSRQKIQEENISLRGENYNLRHKERINVINQLNNY